MGSWVRTVDTGTWRYYLSCSWFLLVMLTSLVLLEVDTLTHSLVGLVGRGGKYRGVWTSVVVLLILRLGCVVWRRRRLSPPWRRSPSWSAPTRILSSVTTLMLLSLNLLKRRFVRRTLRSSVPSLLNNKLTMRQLTSATDLLRRFVMDRGRKNVAQCTSPLVPLSMLRNNPGNL